MDNNNSSLSFQYERGSKCSQRRSKLRQGIPMTRELRREGPNTHGRQSCVSGRLTDREEGQAVKVSSTDS